jgi:hypothetical protein
MAAMMALVVSDLEKYAAAGALQTCLREQCYAAALIAHRASGTIVLLLNNFCTDALRHNPCRIIIEEGWLMGCHILYFRCHIFLKT